jgi:CheY-like chemotaxis protein
MALKRVLIVDDEFHIRQLLGVVLKGVGYEVEYATNGMEALKRCQELPPDLMILDINMPQLGGWDVLSAVRAMDNTRKMPVLMCTSKNLVADVEKADELGATAYVPKPFDIDRLVKKVKELIG